MDLDALSPDVRAIWSRAASRHDATCLKGVSCTARDWHITTDYWDQAKESAVAECAARLVDVKTTRRPVVS